MRGSTRVGPPGPESDQYSNYYQAQNNPYRVCRAEPTLPICRSCSSHETPLKAAVLDSSHNLPGYAKRRNVAGLITCVTSKVGKAPPTLPGSPEATRPSEDVRRRTVRGPNPPAVCELKI